MSDRDERGRFREGWRGGPGRPPRQKEEQYLSALTTELSLDEWRAIVQKAIELAKDGDKASRDWLSKYALDVGELEARLEDLERTIEMRDEELVP